MEKEAVVCWSIEQIYCAKTLIAISSVVLLREGSCLGADRLMIVLNWHDSSIIGKADGKKGISRYSLKNRGNEAMKTMKLNLWLVYLDV